MPLALSTSINVASTFGIHLSSIYRNPLKHHSYSTGKLASRNDVEVDHKGSERRGNAILRKQIPVYRVLAPIRLNL
jgi:hypothetical protein